MKLKQLKDLNVAGKRVLLRIATVLPGQTGTASARLRPGTYELVSTVARDEQLGQRGTLEVR